MPEIIINGYKSGRINFLNTEKQTRSMETANDLFGEEFQENGSVFIFRNLLEFMAFSILFCLVCVMSGIFYLMLAIFRLLQ